MTDTEIKNRREYFQDLYFRLQKERKHHPLIGESMTIAQEIDWYLTRVIKLEQMMAECSCSAKERVPDQPK